MGALLDRLDDSVGEARGVEHLTPLGQGTGRMARRLPAHGAVGSVEGLHSPSACGLDEAVAVTLVVDDVSVVHAPVDRCDGERLRHDLVEFG
ncbi:hypothetical protein [Streptomyces sp. NPDC052036]|uniref:hypothetical protein n=1 Tax=unclassified Streptomyces TaxID=2593676 RepID=UPI0034139D46